MCVCACVRDPYDSSSLLCTGGEQRTLEKLPHPGNPGMTKWQYFEIGRWAVLLLSGPRRRLLLSPTDRHACSLECSLKPGGACPAVAYRRPSPGPLPCWMVAGDRSATPCIH